MATEIQESGFIACTYSKYQELIESPDFNPYWFYLVNQGVESGVNTYTEIYYGYNRLTDLKVIEVEDGEFSEEVCSTVPNNKIIVQVHSLGNSGNNTVEFEPVGLAVKYNNQLFRLGELARLKTDGQGTKFLSDNGSYIEVQGGGGGGTTYTAGNGISIDTTNNVISAKIKPNEYLILNANGLSVDRTSLDVEKVKQLAVITTNAEYPLLLGYDTSTGEVINAVNKTNTLKYNPNSGTLTATKFVGDGSGLTNLPGGGGGGTTYQAGNGIDINSTTIGVLLKSNAGLSFDNRELQIDLQSVQNAILIDDGIVGVN